MKIPIRKKLSYCVPQPMTTKEWSFGYIIGFTRAGDDRPYAVVLTEHDEFEMVMLYGVVHEARYPFTGDNPTK